MEFKPIVPFEPISTDNIPQGEDWVAQVKWDGVRVLTYNEGKETRLFNRRLNERTLQFPELTDVSSFCRESSVILDGEIVALEKGKPSFHMVMKRDGVRNLDNLERARRSVPITYMIFDILYFGGKWVTDLPLVERQRLLEKVIIPGDTVQLVENFYEGEALYRIIESQGMEGIVAKNLNSKYLIKGKDKRWQKRKNYRDIIAVIGGVTFRGPVVNSVLLGLYDSKGQFWYIGHAGTGKLSHDDWRELTERIKPLIITAKPFVNKPERLKDAVWLDPKITAKIKFTEWTEGHNLRQPSIQAFVDLPPEKCTLE